MPSHHRHDNHGSSRSTNQTTKNVNVIAASNENENIELEAAATVPTPQVKPPSIYHTFSGDAKSQDIFANAIREQQDQPHPAGGGIRGARPQTNAAASQQQQRFRILFPGSDTFEMERYDVWNHNDICTPALILQPRNAHHVSCCIRGYNIGLKRCLMEIKKTGDNTIGLPRLVIAGGGRCSIASFKEGAIVLDLSKMNRIKVDVSHQLVTCQGGTKIVDVDRATSKFQSCVPLSTHSYSGVVGSILGGGYGYACRKYGLTCDNVCKAEVVLGDGRIQRCTFNNSGISSSASDLLWSICGGGGGIAVITSITMKCYPVCNAALLTCPLQASTLKQKRNALRAWSTWINGNAHTPTGFDTQGAPHDVYSTLIISTNKRSKSYKCIATSIDNQIIPQSEEYLELYRDKMEEQQKQQNITQSITRAADGLRFSMNYPIGARSDSNRTNVTTSSNSTVKTGTVTKNAHNNGTTATARSNSTNTAMTNNSSNTANANPISWEMIPGLATLCKKAGSGSDISKMVVSKQAKFRMVRYKDVQRFLQDEKLTSPGNHFDAYKYAKALTEPIIDLLVEVTSGSKIPPNPQCQIWISSLGGVISNIPKDQVAFDARDAKFVIHIHGQWHETTNTRTTEKQKAAVQNWVQQTVNHLHMCEGIQSTAHPESLRDQVSKSGKSHPPPGYYNFEKHNGSKLMEIKRKKDRRNVFSLASRVSLNPIASGGGMTNKSLPLNSSSPQRNHTIRQQIMEQVTEEENEPINDASLFPASLLEDDNTRNFQQDSRHSRSGSSRRLGHDGNSSSNSSLNNDFNSGSGGDDDNVRKRVSFDRTLSDPAKANGSEDYEEDFADAPEQDDFFPTSGAGILGGSEEEEEVLVENGDIDDDELKLPLPPGPIDMDAYDDGDDAEEEEDIRAFEEWNAEKEKEQQSNIHNSTHNDNGSDYHNYPNEQQQQHRTSNENGHAYPM